MCVTHVTCVLCVLLCRWRVPQQCYPCYQNIAQVLSTPGLGLTYQPIPLQTELPPLYCVLCVLPSICVICVLHVCCVLYVCVLCVLHVCIIGGICVVYTHNTYTTYHNNNQGVICRICMFYVIHVACVCCMCPICMLYVYYMHVRCVCYVCIVYVWCCVCLTESRKMLRKVRWNRMENWVMQLAEKLWQPSDMFSYHRHKHLLVTVLWNCIKRNSEVQ